MFRWEEHLESTGLNRKNYFAIHSLIHLNLFFLRFSHNFGFSKNSVMLREYVFALTPGMGYVAASVCPVINYDRLMPQGGMFFASCK